MHARTHARTHTHTRTCTHAPPEWYIQKLTLARQHRWMWKRWVLCFVSKDRAVHVKPWKLPKLSHHHPIPWSHPWLWRGGGGGGWGWHLWPDDPASASWAGDTNIAPTPSFTQASCSSYLKIGTLVGWTGWPGVSILWLGEIASLIGSFHLSVTECVMVLADPSLSYFLYVVNKRERNKHSGRHFFPRSFGSQLLYCLI